MNKSVLIGQPMCVTYMGQLLVFRVKRVDEEEGEARGTHRPAIDCISPAEFDKCMNLNDTEQQQQQQQQLTPVHLDPSKFVTESGRLADFKSLPIVVYRVTAWTKLSFFTHNEINGDSDEQQGDEETSDDEQLEEIAGLSKEMEQLREIFVEPFEFADLYRQVGVTFSKAVVLYGPSGCGKTMVAKAICRHSKCNVVELRVANIYSK